MNAFELVTLCLSAVAVVALCGFLGSLKALLRERTRSASLDRELAAAQERNRALESSREEANTLLRAQAAESAGAVTEQLVARANETFQSQQALAQSQLEGQLKPVAEVLQKFEQQVLAIEARRAEESGRLKEQISQLMRASQETQFEARKLAATLRRGAGVQGRWGEQTLRNVLEAAGLNHRFDFSEQVSVDTEEGRLAQSVKTHMLGLSAKAYWDQFESSPDFVAMFVPGDGFLAAVLDRTPDLMTEAMDRRVILVTPTTLFALCKAVAYGWRVEDQAKGAAKTAELGRELYKRLSVMGGHAAALGKALDSAVGRYNSFVGSLESQVMTQARRFEDLAVDHEGKELPELGPVETAVRPLAKLASPSDHALPAPDREAVN